MQPHGSRPARMRYREGTGTKLGMTFAYVRIITHDDLEKKQLRKIIAHYKTLLKRAATGKAKNCSSAEKKEASHKKNWDSIIIKA